VALQNFQHHLISFIRPTAEKLILFILSFAVSSVLPWAWSEDLGFPFRFFEAIPHSCPLYRSCSAYSPLAGFFDYSSLALDTIFWYLLSAILCRWINR
jgi:hypothetical protein